MAKKPDSALQSTRQMLDELDAMMERMLSLPVNELETPDVSAKAPAAAPALTATLTLIEPSVLATPAAPTEHFATNPPHLPMPPAPLPAAQPVAEAAPEPEMLTNDVVPASVLPGLESLLAAMPEPAPEPTTRLIYLPLVWINQLFDIAASILIGGGWLRTDGGRLILGLSGVAMLIASAGWLLKDWLGWNW